MSARGALLLLALLLVSARAVGAPLHGFTPFPYKIAIGVEDEVFALAAQYGELTSIPRDGKCIPWTEALADAAFPSWLEDQWATDAARIPAGEKVLLFLTPTQQDRHTLAEPCGAVEGIGGSYPAVWQPLEKRYGNLLDRADLQLAYLNYTRRIARAFRADYLIYGIEMTQLLFNDPQSDAWSKFNSLASATQTSLNAEFCDAGEVGCTCDAQSDPCGLRAGIELVAQDLLTPNLFVAGIPDTVRPTAELGDFVAFSFYPFGSEFSECFGDPALPSPPDQWRVPLAAMRAFTQKPIGISQTGYTTENLALSLGACGTVNFNGNETLQRQYLEDLATITRDDAHLFVSWFVPIDYDQLAVNPGLDEIWTYNGLMKSDGTPKEAWNTWLVEFVPEAPQGLHLAGLVAALAGIVRRRRGRNRRETGCDERDYFVRA